MNKPIDTLARLRARSEEAGRFVLPLDRAWADKAHTAYEDLRRAETVLRDPDDPESEKRIIAAQAEVDRITAEAGDQVVVFRFRRLGRAAYDALVSRNPPSEKQKQEDANKPDRERRVMDYDTFGPELLEAVMFDPKLDHDTLVSLVHGSDEETLLSKAEAETLLNAAIAAVLQIPRTLPEGLRLP